MAVVVAISAKFPQLGPEQRSIRYWPTATLSVAAPQLRSIWVALEALAVSVPGALGGSVSGGIRVVALAVFE